MSLVGNSLPGPLAAVSVRRAVAAFLLSGLLVLLTITAVLAFAQRRSAVGEAVRDARTLTNLEAHDVVGPSLTDEVLVPGPALDRLDGLIRDRVLGALIVRVKIWNADGKIIYSDDRSLIGQSFDLQPEELEALQNGHVVAEVSDLREEENVDEVQFGKLLQVYLGVRTTSGRRLLFETYQPYKAITDQSRRMWLSSLPVLVGGLAMLYVVQAPLAYRMAKRLRSAQEDREQLLVASLAASDRERSRIAADLHDGVVQGLAGASYTLSAVAGTSRARGQDEVAQTVQQTATDLRRWVRELRSLIVTVTPPALHTQGLRRSLTDLVATLEGRGLAVHLEAAEVTGVPEDSEALAYRVAQEAVRNIVRHADARTVTVRLRIEPDLQGPVLVLAVVDDGRGFDPDGVTRRHGSVGLELLASVVQAHGGQLVVSSVPTEGSTVTLRVMLPHEAFEADLPAVAAGV